MPENTKSSEANEFLRISRAARSKLADLARRATKLADAGSDDPIGAHRAVVDELAKWAEGLEILRENLTSAATALKPLRDSAEEELFDRLRRRLEEQGHDVFGGTGLMVVDGTIHVEIDLKAGRVLINGEKATTLSVSHLVSAIEEELTNLMQDSVAEEEFAGRLLNAYERCLAQTGGKSGSQVKTLDLLPLLALDRQGSKFLKNPSAGNFKGYSAVQFRADLSKLLRASPPLVRGRRFKWASGSTTDGAVFMYVAPLQRTAHLGRIWFDSEEGEKRGL